MLKEEWQMTSNTFQHNFITSESFHEKNENYTQRTFSNKSPIPQETLKINEAIAFPDQNDST